MRNSFLSEAAPGGAEAQPETVDRSASFRFG
jgi:hypothetical protein